MILATVSMALIEDWLVTLRRICPDDQMASFLERSGLISSQQQLYTRVTLDQIVRLYQIAAVARKSPHPSAEAAGSIDLSPPPRRFPPLLLTAFFAILGVCLALQAA